MRGLTLLGAVSKDARIYFAVITTSYLVIVIMYFCARVGFSVSASEFDVR